MTQSRLARVLIIAGSDSGGGAGIQADIKTASAFRVYAATALTAVTVQDTLGLHGVHPIPEEIVRGQISRVLSDIGADAIKIGMLGSEAVMRCVAEEIRTYASGIPVIVDPVMVAKGGASLIDDDAVETLKRELLPLATVLTPNVPEAGRLTGITPTTPDSALRASQRLSESGVRHVLFKGGHAAGDVVVDRLVDCQTGKMTVLESARIDTPHTHGTGCTLATAIACGLARGVPLETAVARAHAFVQEAIAHAPGLGHGHGPLNHLIDWTP